MKKSTRPPSRSPSTLLEGVFGGLADLIASYIFYNLLDDVHLPRRSLP